MTGETLPYSMASDWAVTVFVLVAFFIIAIVVGRGRKLIQQHLKMIFLGKDRASFFDESPGGVLRYVGALNVVTAMLLGVAVFGYVNAGMEWGEAPVSSIVMLTAYSATILFYLLLKGGFYSLVNWVFFENIQQKNWTQTFFDVTGFSCFVIFPVLLLAVYHGVDSIFLECFSIGFLLFVKILLFYKCVKNFFRHLKEWFHLILYFCTLEIIPLFLLWEGVELINSILKLKN